MLTSAVKTDFSPAAKDIPQTHYKQCKGINAIYEQLYKGAIHKCLFRSGFENCYLY